MRNTLLFVILLGFCIHLSPVAAADEATATATNDANESSTWVAEVAQWVASLFDGTAADDEYGGMTAPGG